MHYPEFETAFEAQLQTHTGLYPHAVEYHRARFDQTIQYLLSSILEQTVDLKLLTLRRRNSNVKAVPSLIPSH